MLSIIVPTYNRNDKVLTLLRKIDEINGNYKIPVLIIDNNSDNPTEEFLCINEYSFGETVQVLRNNGNLGLGGNLINCFLHCQTEWMWLLGDDDIPLDNSIDKILSEIEKTGEKDFLIKYNSSAGKFPSTNKTISNIKDLIDFNTDIGYYSNMLFISNSIFRTKEMLTQTFYMMGSVKTMAPHLVGVYRCVQNGFSIKIVNEHIINHGIPESLNNHWDKERLISGLLFFIDSEISDDIKKELLPGLFLNYVGGVKFFYRRILVYPFKSSNWNRYYWSHFFLKAANLFNGPRLVYLIILGILIRNGIIFKLLSLIFKKRQVKNQSLDVFRN
jgi:glycosyltransferase involved in cell wall biosynthesis